MIETDLPNLDEWTFADVRTRPGLDEAVATMLGQAVKPRRNLGSSGPPGRAD